MCCVALRLRWARSVRMPRRRCPCCASWRRSPGCDGPRERPSGRLARTRGRAMRNVQGGLVVRSGCLLFLTLSFAHALRAAERITAAIDNSRRLTLPGHVTPRIGAAVDQGPVDSSMQLPYVTLMLAPSAAQQADLDRLLARQQDPRSPDYHNWLTPEQYADRFGLSRADINKLVAWLQQYGPTVKSVARGRNAIVFGGTAGQIRSAFGVEIHRYQVGAETHYANAADPTIPAALGDVVLAIRGLHNFRWKPMLRRVDAHPRDTIAGVHYLAPDDVASIYNITPLYNSGIDGAGQSLAVVGQTDIVLAD